MTLPALYDMTVEQAAAAAAELAVCPRYGCHTKVAFELPKIITDAAGTLRDKGTELWNSVADSSVGQSIGDAAGKARSGIMNSGVGQHISKGWADLTPETRQSISRAGIGAAVGGGIGLGSGIVRRKRPLSGALTGALAGGAVGAGYDMIDRSGLVKEMLGKVDKPVERLVEYKRPDGSTGKINMTKLKEQPAERQQQVIDSFKSPKEDSPTGRVADTMTFGTLDGRTPVVSPVAGATYTGAQLIRPHTRVGDTTNSSALGQGLSNAYDQSQERAKTMRSGDSATTGTEAGAKTTTSRSLEDTSKTNTPGQQATKEVKVFKPGAKSVQETVNTLNDPAAITDKVTTTTPRPTGGSFEPTITDRVNTTKTTDPFTDTTSNATGKTNTDSFAGNSKTTEGTRATDNSASFTRNSKLDLHADPAIAQGQQAFVDDLAHIVKNRPGNLAGDRVMQLLSDVRKYQMAEDFAGVTRTLDAMDPTGNLSARYTAAGPTNMGQPLRALQVSGTESLAGSTPGTTGTNPIMRVSLMQKLRNAVSKIPLGERAQTAIRGRGDDFVNMTTRAGKMRTVGQGLGLTALGMGAEYLIRDKIMKAREASQDQALRNIYSQ